MSRRVPEIESHHGNNSPPPTSHINRCRTSEEMKELQWHGNQPIKLHPQSENSNNISPPSQPPLPPPPPSTGEDEMAAWLHYPLSFNNPNSSTQIPPPRPPPYLSKQPFSTVTSQPVETVVVPPEVTVVESSGSPTMVAADDGGGVKLKKSGGSGDSTAYTWSYSESETNTTTTDTKTNTTLDTISDNEVTSEDTELECVVAKKLKRHNGSTSSMRSCASEVHNPPQRKHRDRVKEKMKALQELIPNLDKSDESSMLDNVIDYMKALQMHVQLQMMSMGCPIDPSMFPGSRPPYVQPTGMGMGMARPVMTTYTSPVSYPGLLTTSPVGVLLPNQDTTSTQLPCVLQPMHPVPAPGFSVMQPTSSLPLQPSGMQPYPNVGNPYQQYMAVPQMQMQMPMPRIGTPMHFVQNTSPSQPALSSETGMSVTGKENTDKKDG